MMRLLAVASLLAFAGPAAAQSQARGNARDPYLVQVRPGAKLFFEDREGQRLGKAYVIPGDRLAAHWSDLAYTRVTYVAKNGRAQEGWLPTARLARIALPPVRPADWVGEWNAGGKGWNAELTITRGKRPGTLHIDGGAVEGTDDPWRVEHGAVHVGQFEDEVVPTAARMRYSGEFDGETPCKIDMRLLGPYLIAEDNEHCGAQGVTFTAIYRR